jgi:hypothetical protein
MLFVFIALLGLGLNEKYTSAKRKKVRPFLKKMRPFLNFRTTFSWKNLEVFKPQISFSTANKTANEYFFNHE